MLIGTDLNKEVGFMAGMSKFKRLMAMMMAVIMAFTMIPAEAFAHTDRNDADVI